MLTLLLRDLNPAIVQAWKAVFADCHHVDAAFGNILETPADAIISPANSFGFMDGGIDLAYTHFFGWQLQQRLQEIIQNEHHGELLIGDCILMETQHPHIPFLLSCPTMRVPGDVSNTMNAFLAFRAALLKVKHYNATASKPIETILCPGLGTLTGRISPEHCALQMRYAYEAVVKETVPFPKRLWDETSVQEKLTNFKMP
jgi:O-acetyl-ADP-ribose deacetylase (regulator of RNase III)